MHNKPTSIILGLSFYYHDSAAALIVDGKVVAATQEERFTRIKHDKAFPIHSAEFCLVSQGLSIGDVDTVAFYDKPIVKFERLLQSYIRTWPKGLRSFLLGMESALTKNLWVERPIRKTLGFLGEILYTEHHIAHAASSYYCSGFSDATVVTMDGVGEWDTTTVGSGRGSTLALTEHIEFPHSLGLLYSALTYYLGFKVNSAEYKVMGLAPYGDPKRFEKEMRKLIDIKNDGSFKLTMRYFAYEYGLVMTNKAFDRLFGAPPRHPDVLLTQREKDIAASLQMITEEVVLKIAKHAKRIHPSNNLCLSGGVALNCVANGLILKKGLFKNIYIQPAAGDAGGALGAGLYVYYSALNHPLQHDVMPNAYLGTKYSESDIRDFLTKTVPEMYHGLMLSFQEFPDDISLAHHSAGLITGTNVIGLFEGRMEFGPRALGNRSIIADARVKENWQKVNLKIKFRESFRPFAPSVLWERAKDYFDLSVPSPYMLLVAPVLTDTIPAVTHVDGSARVQTVTERENPLYYKILRAFDERTGCAVIKNTSFNVRGEPIVESPQDAFHCFVNTEMDYLVLGRFVISKKDNPALSSFARKDSYLKQFTLD